MHIIRVGIWIELRRLPPILGFERVRARALVTIFPLELRYV